VVEFGASLGVSTLYLAAALKDSGGGSLVTTELLASKAESARRNLIDAGLDSLVELRVGDARDTLRHLDGTVDLLFLDGRNDLYLDVLHVVEPHMRSAALVVADLNVADPDLLPYLMHIRHPANGYRSVEVPLADGVELSVRLPL
jgi:predicted O-methyltransferase YrrM